MKQKKLCLAAIGLLAGFLAHAQVPQLKRWYLSSKELNMQHTTPTVAATLAHGSTGPQNGLYYRDETFTQFYIDSFTVYGNSNSVGLGYTGSTEYTTEISVVPFLDNTPCHNGRYHIFL